MNGGETGNGHQDRVQGGRISKARVREKRKKELKRQCITEKRETVAERLANRHPLQPREELRREQGQQPAHVPISQTGMTRSGRQFAHVPIPQDRATRSGRGQIPQFDNRKLPDGRYSHESLHSKGGKFIHLPRSRY